MNSINIDPNTGLLIRSYKKRFRTASFFIETVSPVQVTKWLQDRDAKKHGHGIKTDKQVIPIVCPSFKKNLDIW